MKKSGKKWKWLSLPKDSNQNPNGVKDRGGIILTD